MWNLATGKVRIFELAKELGLTSKELISLFNERLGGVFEAKNQLSVVPDQIADLVRSVLLKPGAGNGGAAVKKAEPEAAAQAEPAEPAAAPKPKAAPKKAAAPSEPEAPIPRLRPVPDGQPSVTKPTAPPPAAAAAPPRPGVAPRPDSMIPFPLMMDSVWVRKQYTF